ncbi:MAG: dihydrofolate reductase [Actinomycetota bacterium]|nr:dihydrofolate reductase [Actinomycetota bacterium]
MTPAGKRIVLVAAVADNGVIGVDGDIPWRIPEDFAHFKATTMGHTLLMGRATYESIGRPLPGRTTLVLTRDPDWSAEGVLVASSLESALDVADGLPGDVMVVGGAAVYGEALLVADEQVLTEVHRSPPGDTFYPPFDTADWTESRREVFDGYERVWWIRAS